MFKLNRDGSGYSVLHSFTGYRSGEDGSWPQGVVEGNDGALYGTTQVGGRPGGDLYQTGSGTVFQVNKDGSGYSVLHRFPAMSGDGIAPWAGLAEGPDGALYGTTQHGGTNDAGTVFKLERKGGGYRVLRSFTGPLASKPDPQGMMRGVMSGVPTRFSGAGEGSGPTGLVQGRDGALYGTTEYHGKNGGGTAFKLKPDGSDFAILHNFPNTDGDGQNPSASMVQGSDGALYGMTKTCSTNTFATVFRLSASVSRPMSAAPAK